MEIVKNKTLIFDIETVGEDFDQMDEVTQNVLTRRVRETSANEELLQEAIQNIRERTALSPLTGEIVAIGVLAVGSDQGAVYFQAPDSDIGEFVEDGIKFVPLTEKEMLLRFWHVARSCQRLVGFNSRSFDAFYLNIRSAVHGIRPSVDLMSSRYLGSQRGQVQHIDLLDQFKYYGAVYGTGLNLHMWCRAFNIESPKDSGVEGAQVGELFAAGHYLDIARYNLGDLHSTRELFKIWHERLNFQG